MLLLTAAQRTSSPISTGWLDVAESRGVGAAPIAEPATVESCDPVLPVGEPVVVGRPGAEQSGDTRRDPLLDLLRAVALVRVVIWHTLPVAALTS